MTDEQILVDWEAARVALAYCGTDVVSYGATLFRKIRAEVKAIERFGLGNHKMCYQRRFEDLRDGPVKTPR